MQHREKLSVIWQGRIDGWLASGMTQTDYCQQQGISLYAFGYWRSRLNKVNKLKKEKPLEIKSSFVPLKIEPAIAPHIKSPDVLEIEINSTLKIKGITKDNVGLTASLISLLKDAP
jgi:hypothetical protein